MIAAAYEINGQSVNAEAFYAVACDPGRSVAVEACAGAGKTWILVSRIVRALLDGATAHEILAITFTKRAAGEMRERLFKLLRDFSQMDADELAIELISRGSANTPDNRQKLSNLYRQVLQQDRQVQVRTFHSWFGAILRSAPLALLELLGLPANHELLEDDSEAKALAWRRFHAALLASGEDAQQLHTEYLALVQLHGRSQAEVALSAALNNRQEFLAADVGDALASSVQHFTRQFPEFAGCADPLDRVRRDSQCWVDLAEAGRFLGQASLKPCQVQGALLEQAWSSGDADGALSALLTKDGVARKFSDKILGISHVRAMQDIALRVRAAQVQHAAWQHQQRMTALTRVLVAQYNTLKRQRGWVDMIDVERAAGVLLGDPILSGWMQQRLDARVSHLLIDEFQDTNPIQWQALSSWLSAYAGSGGGSAPSVFLVGDPKQSIYRFRRAEPQVFITAQRFVREGLQGDVLSCDHTRRNAPEVIGAVNQVMQTAMRNGEYPVYRQHTTASSSPGRMCRLPQILRSDRAKKADASPLGEWRDSLANPQTTVEEDLHAQEARQAAMWVAAQVQCGVRPADIMVLARTRVALSPMLEALRECGVPALLADKAKLIDTCEVQDVVALLDALVSPQHNLSLARVMKSPILGWSDEELIPLALVVRQNPGMAWWDALQPESLLVDRQSNAWRAAALQLRRWQTWVAQLPPHDALQAIYSDGHLLERYAAAAPVHLRDAVLDNLQAVLGVALDVGGGRFATPYALVRWLKAGHGEARAPASSDVVRLMTIHGAKGLEADTVLMLDAARGPTRKPSMGVLVDWPGEAPRPRRVAFLASESRPSPCVADLLQSEQTERDREELNALYVAMTRARHTLVLSSIEPQHSGGTTWWSRLLDMAVEVPVAPEAVRAATPLRDKFDAIFQLKIIPNSLIFHEINATENIANESSVDSARIGRAMHRLLQWGRTDATSSAAAAHEFRLSVAQGDQARLAAERIMQGDGAWAWDASQLAWQGDEVELHFEGALLRLDRLVQRVNDDGSKTWWVLDHKSNAHPQEDATLVAQLMQYRHAVTALLVNGDEAQVRAAFLTADGRMVELE